MSRETSSRNRSLAVRCLSWEASPSLRLNAKQDLLSVRVEVSLGSVWPLGIASRLLVSLFCRCDSDTPFTFLNDSWQVQCWVILTSAAGSFAFSEKAALDCLDSWEISKHYIPRWYVAYTTFWASSASLADSTTVPSDAWDHTQYSVARPSAGFFPLPCRGITTIKRREILFTEGLSPSITLSDFFLITTLAPVRNWLFIIHI